VFGVFGADDVQSRHVRERADEVREYLEANLTRDLDINEVARAASLSPFYLTRIFKARYGVPPYRYLIRLRIDRADLSPLGVQLAVALHHHVPPAHRDEPVRIPTHRRLAAGCRKVRAEHRSSPQTTSA
jgi:hypothetical protein